MNELFKWLTELFAAGMTVFANPITTDPMIVIESGASTGAAVVRLDRAEEALIVVECPSACRLVLADPSGPALGAHRFSATSEPNVERPGSFTLSGFLLGVTAGEYSMTLHLEGAAAERRVAPFGHMLFGKSRDLQIVAMVQSETTTPFVTVAARAVGAQDADAVPVLEIMPPSGRMFRINMDRDREAGSYFAAIGGLKPGTYRFVATLDSLQAVTTLDVPEREIDADSAASPTARMVASRSTVESITSNEGGEGIVVRAEHAAEISVPVRRMKPGRYTVTAHFKSTDNVLAESSVEIEANGDETAITIPIPRERLSHFGAAQYKIERIVSTSQRTGQGEAIYLAR